MERVFVDLDFSILERLAAPDMACLETRQDLAHEAHSQRIAVENADRRVFEVEKHAGRVGGLHDAAAVLH